MLDERNAAGNNIADIMNEMILTRIDYLQKAEALLREEEERITHCLNNKARIMIIPVCDSRFLCILFVDDSYV